MRILCCLNRDLAANVALNHLLPALASHEVRVGLTERVGGASAPVNEPGERRELRVAEQQLPNDVFFPLVERASLPDDGRRFLTFAEIERYRGIPVAPLPNPNRDAGLETLRAFAPDLVISIRYGAIFKTPAIAVPRLGILNLHSGVLPDYRGVLATFRALMHHDAEIGCTLHYITDGTIDTGAIVDIARVPVVSGRSLLGHVLSLYEPGVAMIVHALQRLSRGEALLATPAVGAGAYFSAPTADEWTAFTSAGWTVALPSDLDACFARYLPPPVSAMS